MILRALIWIACMGVSLILQAQAPFVFSTFPTQGGQNLSCYTPVYFTVKFSAEGNAFQVESFIPDNIRLYPKGKARKQVSIKLSYDANIKKVTVSPLELLKPETWYVMEVKEGLEDNRGQGFSPFKLEFKTGDCPGVDQDPEEPITEAPVEAVELDAARLVNFKARPYGDSVEIIWHMSENLLIEEYFIDKSMDKERFFRLASSPSLGETGQQQVYRIFDGRPAMGWNYYRIGVKSSLDEARLLDTLAYFSDGVKFKDRRIAFSQPLPLTFFSRRPTSMVMVLKELNSGKVVFRKATLLPEGVRDVSIPLEGVDPGTYVIIIQTTEIAVKSKIQILRSR